MKMIKIPINYIIVIYMVFIKDGLTMLRWGGRKNFILEFELGGGGDLFKSNKLWILIKNNNLARKLFLVLINEISYQYVER